MLQFSTLIKATQDFRGDDQANSDQHHFPASPQLSRFPECLTRAVKVSMQQVFLPLFEREFTQRPLFVELKRLVFVRRQLIARFDRLEYAECALQLAYRSPREARLHNPVVCESLGMTGETKSLLRQAEPQLEILTASKRLVEKPDPDN